MVSLAFPAGMGLLIKSMAWGCYTAWLRTAKLAAGWRMRLAARSGWRLYWAARGLADADTVTDEGSTHSKVT